MRRVGPVSFSVIVDNRSFDFDVARDGEETVVASRSGSTRLTVADAARRTARAAGKRREVSGRVEIKSAMPGRVVNVLVAAGDEVKADQGIIVVEAMKMENEVKSPKAGKVVEVKVVAGQAVEKGQLDDRYRVGTMPEDDRKIADARKELGGAQTQSFSEARP